MQMPSPADAPEHPHPAPGVPRWPAAVALLLIGGIYLLVSERLTLGPPWLLLLVIVVLLPALRVARLRGRHDLTRRIGLALISLVTLAVVVSTISLVIELTRRNLPPQTLLQGAALIWVVNVLTFAVWYWEIDGGGPGQRHRDRHASTDFLFPQLAAPDSAIRQGWSPGFLDYLFLAFNTSTAFSPTDTMVLSRRAKALMMLQSLISLLTIAVLVERAINTL